MNLRVSLSSYYHLTKPGIVWSNSLAALAGYLYASSGLTPLEALAVLSGTAGIVASGCVINNYFDRYIDAEMERTKKRALVTGIIRPKSAFLYSAALLLVGIVVLAAFTNMLTLLLGIVAWVSYSFIYTFAKHKTVHSTLIGTIPGAIPPVAGYAAATGQLNLTSMVLFLLWVFWQLPHFYAIAVRRFEQYKRAAVPVSSVAYGLVRTRQLIIIGSAGFLLAVILLYLFGGASVMTTIVLVMLAAGWLRDSLALPKSTKPADNVPWATHIFGQSLIILLVMMALLSLDGLW